MAINYPQENAAKGYAVSSEFCGKMERNTAPALPASGQISAHLSGLENDLDNINSIAVALARRLFPVTGLDIDSPVPSSSSNEAMPQATQVPIADRILYMRERLNDTSRILDLVLNRIEI